MPIKILAVPAFKDNYIWLMISQDQKYAVIVDPGDAAPVLSALQHHKLNLTAILITHHHWDHTNGIAELIKYYPVPVFGPATEKIPGVTCPVSEKYPVLLPKLKLTWRVLDIPGHTLGHIAYYNNDSLFCGDTLFTGGCGKLFEGTAAQLHHSLCKLANLPDNTKVYCGHEYTQSNLRFAQIVEPENNNLLYRIEKTTKLREKNLPTVPSTIIEEKQTNPFLRCHIPEVIHSAEQYAGKEFRDPVEVFTCLRGWKNAPNSTNFPEI